MEQEISVENPGSNIPRATVEKYEKEKKNQRPLPAPSLWG